YYNESQAGKEVLPMLFLDGVILPQALAAFISGGFSFSILGFRHYPRHRGLVGGLTGEEMVGFHCFFFYTSDAAGERCSGEFAG
ncbi:hypothetical protein CWI48_03580, partial [Neisseria meningitidis]